ncbi:endonuclease/exonuclease/phosphatase family protein [Candidatus Saccharibacteria bacterium]|nr:endonuclease/exonuclease/phosphatase family protein [Candidatus Saccharibacteria bacterium]
MKILQLNAWTGRIKGALGEFLQKNDYDVICLQEAVWSDNKLLENFALTVDQIKELSRMSYDYRSANWEIEAFGSVVKQGNVILSREEMIEKSTKIIRGEYLSLKSIEDIEKQGYTLQIVKLKNGLDIVNHHGYWRKSPIGNEDTVAAMQKVAGFVRKIEGPVVMCGDLNIIHASPAMREIDFLRDLTEEYGYKNTLNGLKFNGEVACDHILVNEKVKVEKFEVLDNLISDHKGLVAEIAI